MECIGLIRTSLAALTVEILLGKIEVETYDGCFLQSWRCGNICIDETATCHCGDIKMNFGEQWCCSSEPCHGLGNKSFPGKDLFTGIRGLVENRAYGGGGESVFSEGADCSAGTVLHLRQPCHGKCNDINRGIVDH